jgi:hypothetical protein
MSKEQMTEEQATLYREVYVPAFLDKCAELGVDIHDPETLESALETTALVKQTLQKSGSNQIKQENAALKQALGIHVQDKVEHNTNRIKAAAAHLGNIKEIREALRSSQS